MRRSATVERAVHASAWWRHGDVVRNLWSVSADVQPQELTPCNSSLLTPTHLSFELSFDRMESEHMLPEYYVSVYTVSSVCVCLHSMTLTSHLNLIRCFFSRKCSFLAINCWLKIFFFVINSIKLCMSNCSVNIYIYVYFHCVKY